MSIYKYQTNFKDTAELKEWETHEILAFIYNTESIYDKARKGKYHEAINIAESYAGITGLCQYQLRYIQKDLYDHFKNDPKANVGKNMRKKIEKWIEKINEKNLDIDDQRSFKYL